MAKFKGTSAGFQSLFISMKLCRYFFLLGGMLMALGPVLGRPIPGIISVQQGQMIRHGKPYYFVGANYWYGGVASLTEAGRRRVVAELDFLQQNGVTNLRIMAAAEGKGPINGMRRVEPAYQHPQSVFDDSILTGLDFVLSEMKKRDMTAVLFLTNNWDWSGGFLQYLNWNGLLPDSVMQRKLSWNENRDVVSRFYTCMPCMDALRQQIKNLVNRVNTITGVAYKEDPVIMSWELANEPRPMRPSAIQAYVQWAEATAALIKEMDANHLVTTGSEGEMGSETMEVFRKVHALPQIDYATIHIWPKNWGWFSDTAIALSLPKIVMHSDDYILKHIAIAQALKKPLVIEEFGLPRNGHSFSPEASTSLRDTYYAAVFAHLRTAARQGGLVAGCNFWAVGGQGRPVAGRVFWHPGDDLLGDPPQEEQGLNAVFDTDKSTWELIRSTVAAIKN
jgi:mannan endo-1,4-beta-mannosidase